MLRCNWIRSLDSIKTGSIIDQISIKNQQKGHDCNRRRLASIRKYIRISLLYVTNTELDKFIIRMYQKTHNMYINITSVLQVSLVAALFLNIHTQKL